MHVKPGRLEINIMVRNIFFELKVFPHIRHSCKA